MKILPILSLALACLIINQAAAQNSTTAQSDPSAQSSWSEQKRHKHFNLEDEQLGIDGYDPVAYFEGKPTKGKKSISSVYQGVTYRFANAANKQKFDATPAKYEPAYGGWCAWAMAKDGDKVEVDPKSYKIVDGRLFLYYDGFWGDTRKQWNESGEEKQLTTDADANWRKLTD